MSEAPLAAALAAGRQPPASVLTEQLRLKAFPRRVAVGADDDACLGASMKEHLAIARAVLKGDAEAAQAAMHAHLAHAQERLRALIPADA